MIQDKPLHTSWQHKMKIRQEKKLIKDFAQELKEQKQREREVSKMFVSNGSNMSIILNNYNVSLSISTQTPSSLIFFVTLIKLWTELAGKD